MRLLQAIADGRLGGGTTHVLQLIAAVREDLGAEVHLVTQSDSPARCEARRHGAVVHPVDFFPSRFNPHVWLELGRVVGRVKPDLVHAHGARAALPMTSATGRIPMIYSVRGYHFVGKPAVVRQLAIAVERRCSARAELTLFVSEHDRELAERSGILQRCRRHRVLLNSLDLDPLPQAVGSLDGRRLGYLGRLSPEKNPLFLLEVLHLLRAGGYRLTVIGDGEQMARMRDRAAALELADRVEFLGGLPRAEALHALAHVDVLLLPSLWEGLPHAPIEAGAMGVPVVAHAVGGVPEIVEDGRTGLLLDDLNPEHWATAVRRLTQNPDLRARIVADGRASIQRQFSWATNRKAYLDLYRHALGLP